MTAEQKNFMQNLIVRLAKNEIEKNDAVKSKILGNAIYLAKSKTLPENIELNKLDFYLKNSQEDKKIIISFLDKMKYPGFDFSKEFLKIILDNWILKDKIKKENNIKNVKQDNFKKNFSKKNIVNKKENKAKPVLDVNIQIKRKRIINSPT